MTGDDMTSDDITSDDMTSDEAAGRSHDFDESLISGYIDGELTQGDRQRVRLHLDSCAACRAIADQLKQLQEATMATTFELPGDTQWDETPRSTLSRALQYLGWGLLAVWAVALAAVLIWQLTTGGEAFQLEGLLGLIPLAALASIVWSALIDRSKTRKTDPYRKVQK